LSCFAVLVDSSSAQPFTRLNAPFGKISGNAAWADFDNDGDLDLVLGRYGNPGEAPAVTRIFRNDGAGTFTELDAGLVNVAGGAQFAVGDYDRDGRVDLAIQGNELLPGNFTPSRSLLFRNLGALVFARVDTGWPQLPAPPFGLGTPFDWGDFDRDGDLDLLHSGPLGSLNFGRPIVQINQGNGTFAPVELDFGGAPAHPARWGDVDADGELDVLFSFSEYSDAARALVRRNLGDGRFLTLSNLAAMPVTSYFIDWADADGDGDLDAVKRRFRWGGLSR
jgi:hypothetical protein